MNGTYSFLQNYSQYAQTMLASQGINSLNPFQSYSFQYPNPSHSTTNIFWFYPELFYHFVYPNSNIYMNNSNNNIIVNTNTPNPPNEKAPSIEPEKPMLNKKKEEKKPKETKILGRKKRRVTKMCTACPHKYAMHYAKNMCSNCYHAKGRSKKPWNCTHVNKSHYALGLCQNCYQMNYIKKQSEQEIESVSKGSLDGTKVQKLSYNNSNSMNTKNDYLKDNVNKNDNNSNIYNINIDPMNTSKSSEFCVKDSNNTLSK